MKREIIKCLGGYLQKKGDLLCILMYFKTFTSGLSITMSNAGQILIIQLSISFFSKMIQFKKINQTMNSQCLFSLKLLTLRLFTQKHSKSIGIPILLNRLIQTTIEFIDSAIAISLLLQLMKFLQTLITTKDIQLMMEEYTS